jgi:hypothetical protein
VTCPDSILDRHCSGQRTSATTPGSRDSETVMASDPGSIRAKCWSVRTEASNCAPGLVVSTGRVTVAKLIQGLGAHDPENGRWYAPYALWLVLRRMDMLPTVALLRRRRQDRIAALQRFVPSIRTRHLRKARSLLRHLLIICSLGHIDAGVLRSMTSEAKWVSARTGCGGGHIVVMKSGSSTIHRGSTSVCAESRLQTSGLSCARDHGFSIPGSVL